ncbi:hypothetical protein GPECTOR_43g870 [Gonium pectorale]|uniref:Uncharacterized protein n=1 Tax=Gonium pectorale TaxID=33097 RepID=A0A150G9B2_GONPE|nr:hypothetical protein GPECTOR_43g870 [Gonium pectorale]|eukprot:KXZ46434.1 hypothetical protein GPECTOR_43g870 [Gonium pectorale]
MSDGYALPDELQDTFGAKDTSRPAMSAALASKDARLSAAQQGAVTGDGASPSIAFKDVKQHIMCALCDKPIASCLVPLRATPMRCIAVDAIVEAFIPSLCNEDMTSYKARQEEGKSAANKVNKMFWWLQPSAVPGMPNGGPGMPNSSSGMFGGTPVGAPNMAAMMANKGHFVAPPMPAPLPNGGVMTAGLMGAGAFHPAKGLPPQHGSMRRASQPGGAQSGFPQRRSNSFSAGGAMQHGVAQPSLPPQMAASIAAAGFSAPMMSLPTPGTDMESTYLATAQKFGMEGLALPLVYQQHAAQQQFAAQQLGLLQACSELQAVDLHAASPSGHASYADPAQLQQLLQGLYFA